MAVTRPRIRSNPKLHAFHQTHDALLLAAFAGDRVQAAYHGERLDRLALGLKGDRYIQGLYRQALEIADAPNPRDHALRILESLYPGQARSVTE